MAISKELQDEFIAKMSQEIIQELEEKAQKAGRALSFDDIETGVLLFRQKVGENMLKAVAEKQGSGKLSEKKSATAAVFSNSKDMKTKP